MILFPLTKTHKDYLNALLKKVYFSLFKSNLIYGCQIWAQDQNEESKMTEKLQRSNKDNEFPVLKCSNWKTNVWNEYINTEGVNYALKYLICKRLPLWKWPGCFNHKFKFYSSKLPLNYTTRSSSTNQRKVNNCKTGRYSRKSIENKCTLGRLKKPPKKFKTKLPDDEEMRPKR